MNVKKLVTAILGKVGIALVCTLFFVILALIPFIGNMVDVHVYYPIEKHTEFVGDSEYSYAIVRFDANASFNPMLYPLSWLVGRGHISGNFSMVYMPYVTGGRTDYGETPQTTVWGKRTVVQGEAMMKLVIEELLNNLPLLPAIFFAIELVGRRRLYFWFLGGVVGFIFGTLTGVIVGFTCAVFSTIFLSPNFKRLLGRTTLNA